MNCILTISGILEFNCHVCSISWIFMNSFFIFLRVRNFYRTDSAKLTTPSIDYDVHSFHKEERSKRKKKEKWNITDFNHTEFNNLFIGDLQQRNRYLKLVSIVTETQKVQKSYLSCLRWSCEEIVFKGEFTENTLEIPCCRRLQWVTDPKSQVSSRHQ